MKIESFDQAHARRCPGCGIVDNGNHWGHRYSIPECHHSNHPSSECTEPKYVKTALSVNARFRRAILRDLAS